MSFTQWFLMFRDACAAGASTLPAGFAAIDPVTGYSERMLLVTFLLTVCALTDLKEGKIYNAVLFPSFAAGCLYAACNGFFFTISALGAGAFTVFLLWIPYRLGGIGAGDLKLYLVLALFYPAPVFFPCVFLSFLLALPHSAAWLLRKAIRYYRALRRERFPETGGASANESGAPTYAGGASSYVSGVSSYAIESVLYARASPAAPCGGRIPMAVPIALAFLLALK